MEGWVELMFFRECVKVVKEGFMEGKLVGSETKDEVMNGFSRVVTLRTVRRVC